jgi:CubicO group peptidase (beta-lactamase class C family)
MAHLSDAHQAPILEFVPELDRLAADAMADWKVPGAALAVVQDGKVALAANAVQQLRPVWVTG